MEALIYASMIFGAILFMCSLASLIAWLIRMDKESFKVFFMAFSPFCLCVALYCFASLLKGEVYQEEINIFAVIGAVSIIISVLGAIYTSCNKR